MSDELVTKLNGEIRALMNADDVKAKLSNVGAEVDTSTPQELASWCAPKLRAGRRS